MKDELDVFLVKSERSEVLLQQNGWSDICIKLGNLKQIAITSDENTAGIGFISGTEKCIVVMEQAMDVAAGGKIRRKTQRTRVSNRIRSICTR